MSKQPEALRLADELDACPSINYHTHAAELRRLDAEIERLNSALQREQDRSERIGTHGPGCHLWGHRHHECLEREYREVIGVLKEVVQLWDHHCQAHGDGQPTPLHVRASAAIAKAEVQK